MGQMSQTNQTSVIGQLRTNQSRGRNLTTILLRKNQMRKWGRTLGPGVTEGLHVTNFHLWNAKNRHVMVAWTPRAVPCLTLASPSRMVAVLNIAQSTVQPIKLCAPMVLTQQPIAPWVTSATLPNVSSCFNFQYILDHLSPLQPSHCFSWQFCLRWQNWMRWTLSSELWTRWDVLPRRPRCRRLCNARFVHSKQRWCFAF